MLELWPWNLLVALSAVAAAPCYLAGRGLRLQAGLVLAGACVWFLYWLALVPWEVYSTSQASSGDIATGIGLAVGIDCGAVALGGYHALLCVALLLQAVRLARRRRAARTGP